MAVSMSSLRLKLFIRSCTFEKPAGFALEYRTVYDAAANAAVSSLAAQVASSKSSPVLLRPQALMPNWFGIDLNVRSFGINANACANGARPRED